MVVELRARWIFVPLGASLILPHGLEQRLIDLTVEAK